MKSCKSQDWFMMTGDLIINLRSTKTGDSLLSNNNKKPKELDFECTNNHKRPLEIDQLDHSPTIDQCDHQQTESDAGCFVDDSSNGDNHVDQDDDVIMVDDFDKEEIDHPNQQEKHTFTSNKSNSSSGNSSGTVDDDLCNSQTYSDSISLTSPTKHHVGNCSPTNERYFPDDFSYYYENFDPKQPQENCYENIGDVNYLSKSHESNLYNLIEDSKSFDNLSLDSENNDDDDDDDDIGELTFAKHQNCIDAPSATRLAKRLFNLEGFQKCDVTRHLSKNNEYSRAVADEYLRFFDFSQQNLDEALRSFLSKFYLTGETQERERVLVYFSKRYHECNPDANFKNIDSIHTLTCALMLLNTDLHEENIQRKMTCSDFIINLAGLNHGDDFPSEMLKYLYYSIKQKPLGWNDDEIGDRIKRDRKAFSKMTTISMSSPYATLPRKFCNTLASNPFVEIPNPSVAIEYKKGYIRRKCCYDTNGKKTPIGRRGWKMFYATLRDLVLYLHKDENGFRTSQLQESYANSIRIHHSIASVANDYPKKKFVFRLITADYAEFLFETSDSRELQSWVDTINTTAASLSAPALPMPVSSDNYKFKREIFPVSHTKLSLRDQLNDQENKLLSLQKEVEELLEKSGRNSTNKIYEKNFVEKENYLQHEVKRYRIYISSLKWKLKQQQQQQSDQQSVSDHQSASNGCHSLNKSGSSIYSDSD